MLFFITAMLFAQGEMENIGVEKNKVENKEMTTESDTSKVKEVSVKTKVELQELTEEEFELKLKNLETDVNLLKEKIFRSKARLSTLQETLISGKSIQSAKLIINHINKFSHFNVKSIIYHFDGKPLWASVDTDGNLSSLKNKALYDGVVIPGNHMLSVIIKLEISELGLFDYSKGYQFQIKASHSFHIEEGKVTTINIYLNEKGGYFNKLTDKPDVVFKAGITKDLTAGDINKNKKK
jgi:hypothetical protein